MSSSRYCEIPRESTHNYSKTLRKMSCFDTRHSNRERPRLSKNIFSTNSLPRSGRHTISHVFEVTRIPPEEIAAQFTLIDHELFVKIDLEELICCGWIKKEKNVVAPNVVAYTRRFNHVSYWIVEEILNHESTKVRADVISYFVRVCKRLYDLNNLHSLFAVISALRSASIYRLDNTWSFVPKKDKQAIDRFADIFSDKDNWSKLREMMDSLKLPCVPYIGVYLTDLVYLSMANPSCDYPLKSQLLSVRYIDELLKFVEDDNFKKSLLLEPPSAKQSPQKFVPGHKKNSSWGNGSKLTNSGPESSSSESIRNLIDDSLQEKIDEVTLNIAQLPSTNEDSVAADIIIEGCLRRKTLLKNGKKPPMAAWQRYWVQLWGPVLLYYSSKSLTGTDRSDFKLEPCKMKSILGWLVQMGDDPLHPDSFHLADPNTGTMYKFRSGSTPRSLVWCRKLQECQKKRSRQGNLIRFD
ncbi:Ras-specific guanine nucleotide-releasing factor RalGPS1 [Orchesella cincta]|uniref:Ras-specific guanine nucleotide-releasing factor RalGPS1 n=1 Tax=Orchesella cincta TaxID=48709 RepID=A0A1D2NJ83_ORCCI|nr:Ras-specific guanine nucleotide-releasing factor RalGPS1 [Orchesella cincta]